MRNVIDITDQDQTMHDFAHAATTAPDIVQTKRILRRVYKHVIEFVNIDMRPNSVSFISRNRRSCRIILYDVNKLLHNKDLFVVVFYAHKRPNLSEEFNKEFFETDWRIAMGMMGEGNILCYASQELADGNWFNIVLFSKESDKHGVTSSPQHHRAAYELAPRRFDWIRLHNAWLPEGIATHKDIIFTKTKYYNFDENWFAHRTHRGTAAAPAQQTKAQLSPRLQRS